MLAHCRALIDAAGPACVAVKPQLACFERLGSAGWLALEATCDARARARPARARRRQARRRARHRRGLRAGAGRRHADAVRRRRRASAPTPSPPTRCSAATRSSRWSTARARPAPACSCSCARPTRAPPTSMDLQLADGEPLWERLAALVDELGDARAAPGSPTSARSPAPPRPSTCARMRELMPRTPFLLPGRRRPGRRRRGPRARVRARPRAAASSPRRARSPTRTRARRRPGRGRARRGRAPARGRLGAGLRRRPSRGAMIARDGRVAAPRASWRRSRSWPSCVALFVVVQSASDSERQHDEQRERSRRRRADGRRHDEEAGDAGEAPHLHGQGRRHASGDRREDRRVARRRSRAQPRRSTRRRSRRARRSSCASERRCAVARRARRAGARARSRRRAPARPPPRPPPGSAAPSAIVIEASTGDGRLRARRRPAAPDRLDDQADDRAAHARARAARATSFTALALPRRRRPSRRSGCAPGERMTVARPAARRCCSSANDAAVTLAERRRRLARARSCAQMNARARAARARPTPTTPTRSGSTTPGNYSTARDLGKLALRLRTQRVLPRDRRPAAGHAAARATARARSTTATRWSRSYPWVNGVKTGHTREAGYVLVGSAHAARRHA